MGRVSRPVEQARYARNILKCIISSITEDFHEDIRAGRRSAGLRSTDTATGLRTIVQKSLQKTVASCAPNSAVGHGDVRRELLAAADVSKRDGVAGLYR